MSVRLVESELTVEQMEKNLPAFLGKVSALASDIGIRIDTLFADHIALRINDADLAKQAHRAWLTRGSVISSAVINGRPIIVIEFSQPLAVGGWSIECLELPYPAQGKTYPKQGWEHIEFVVESFAETADEYLTDLKRKLPALADRWANLSEMGVKTKLSSPKGEGERLANPTVAFKRDGVCIKLHPHSLKKIVQSESKREFLAKADE